MPNYDSTLNTMHVTALVENVITIEEAPGLLMSLVGGGRPVTMLDTDVVEFGREDYFRQTSPYIPMRAEPVVVGDRQRSLETVRNVNMALTKSYDPGQLYFDRRMGEPVHVGATERVGRDRLSAKIDMDQRDMVSRMMSTYEWWFSQMILGTISYSDPDYDAFVFEFNRDPDLNVIAGTPWTTAGVDYSNDIQAIKKAVSDLGKRQVRIALCSPEAARIIRFNADIKADLDIRHLNEKIANGTSYLDNTSDYSQEGSITPIGELNGIEFWEYDRTLDIQGRAFPMIRAGYIEFITPASADNAVEGFSSPFHNFRVNNGAPQNIERFSFAYDNLRGDSRHMIVSERKMFVPKRPNVFASLKIN